MRKIFKELEKEHLKFVIENDEDGNKKINVVLEENYMDQKQKSELIDQIKISKIAETKPKNDVNKHANANKWVLKIFFVPKKNKNKWIVFGMDAVLFLIILFAFVMLYFIPSLAFFHSIFAFTLEIICGLLSLAYGIVLIKSICFENKNNEKMIIKSD